MKAKLEEQIHRQRLSVEAMQDELRQRRAKQYEQLSKLQDVEAQLRTTQDEKEDISNEAEVLREASREQELRLAEARRWREAADSEIAEADFRTEREVKAATAAMGAAQDEALALKKQVQELSATVLKLVRNHAEAERDQEEQRQEVTRKQGEIDELTEQLARVAAEATQQGRARLAADVQRETITAQLAQLRGKVSSGFYARASQHSF
jgi:chromosome segregation ATPase